MSPRVVHDLMFFRLRLNSINMIAQYPNLLPSRSLLVRTCIIPTVFWHKPQSMKFLQQPSSKTLTLHKSDVPRRSVGWKTASFHAYVRTRICLISGKPTDRISSCIQGSIRTMRQKLHHLRTRLDMRVKNCISHTSCMTFKSGFFFWVGVDKWCSWWKYAGSMLCALKFYACSMSGMGYHPGNPWVSV